MGWKQESSPKAAWIRSRSLLISARSRRRRSRPTGGARVATPCQAASARTATAVQPHFRQRPQHAALIVLLPDLSAGGDREAEAHLVDITARDRDHQVSGRLRVGRVARVWKVSVVGTPMHRRFKSAGNSGSTTNH